MRHGFLNILDIIVWFVTISIILAAFLLVNTMLKGTTYQPDRKMIRGADETASLTSLLSLLDQPSLGLRDEKGPAGYTLADDLLLASMLEHDKAFSLGDTDRLSWSLTVQRRTGGRGILHVPLRESCIRLPTPAESFIIPLPGRVKLLEWLVTSEAGGLTVCQPEGGGGE